MAKSKTVRMIMLTNSDGAIIAAARTGQSSGNKMNIAIQPLAGQQIHEVELPQEYASLTGPALQAAFSQVRLQPGKKPAFKELKVQREKR